MKNVQTIIINGLEVQGELSTLRALLGMAEAVEVSEVAETQAMEEISKPKAAPAKKPGAKSAKKAKTPKAPKAEEPKGEVPEPKEPVYTPGGCLLQWGDEIAAKGKEKGVITKGYNSLVSQGFTVTKKRVGTYVYLYHAKDAEKSSKGKPVFIDGKTSKEFNAASLDSGWVMIRGGWAYPDLLKGYDDCFRPEK